jgi:hydroxymethylpyrimidine pyrophosphatase-like HAD family hydrolase
VENISTLANSDTLTLLNHLQEAGIKDYGLYNESAWYASRQSAPLQAEASHGGVEPHEWRIVQDLINQQQWLKLQILGEASLLKSFVEQLAPTMAGRVELQFSGSDCLEVTAKGVTKGSALKSILINEKLIAIGNGGNDVSMFEVAADSYAMANSPGSVKQAANRQAPSNNEHGVAFVLRAFSEQA